MERIAQKQIQKQLKKNTIPGKIKIQEIFFLIFLLFIFNFKSFAGDVNLVEIKILDKISSKTSQLSLNIGEETKFENLIIKVMKCKNSEFDDNPEVTAYMQVQDITLKNNDKVFVFNGWTFSSSPTLKPFDHPVYDLWVTGCENI